MVNGPEIGVQFHKSRGDFSVCVILLHGLVSDLLTKLSPSQRHLPGTHCQLTFVIVVARQHSRNISRLSCFMELLICISILVFPVCLHRQP